MSRTPSLEEVIEQAIDDKLCDLHTCLPCIVDSYDASKQSVVVKIALMKKYDTGELVERPTIPDVRVNFAKGGNSSFTFPIKQGDEGFLMFSERSLERWRVGTGIVDPKDSRKFHLSDCYFVPMAGRDADLIAGTDATKTRLVNDKSIIEMSEDGTILIKNDVNSFEVKSDGDINFSNGAAQISFNPDGLIELKNAQGKIRITPDGKFKIEGAQELLEIIGRFIDTMNGATTLTAFGLQPFFPPTPASLTQLKTDLLAITE